MSVEYEDCADGLLGVSQHGHCCCFYVYGHWQNTQWAENKRPHFGWHEDQWITPTVDKQMQCTDCCLTVGVRQLKHRHHAIVWVQIWLTEDVSADKRSKQAGL